jgi:hypothetical protein
MKEHIFNRFFFEWSVALSEIEKLKVEGKNYKLPEGD